MSIESIQNEMEDNVKELNECIHDLNEVLSGKTIKEIRIREEVVEEKKGRVMCKDCGKGMHSRHTDNRGNARAIKITVNGDFKVKIYEFICPYSHTKYLKKTEAI